MNDFDFLTGLKIRPDSDMLGIAMLADRRYQRRVAEAELVATVGGDDDDTEPSRLESLVTKGALIRFAPCECGGRRHVAPSGDWACVRCQRSGGAA